MALAAVVLISAVLILVIIRFEQVRPRPRDLMPVVVLAALAILGRLLFTPIPNFQPTTAIIILAGLYFGRNSGLLCGMVVAFVSNFFVGQGLWTPWQMLLWGLIGYFAGVTGQRISMSFDMSVSDTGLSPLTSANTSNYLTCTVERPLNTMFMYIYGAVASFLFGIIMDLQFFISYTYSSGWGGLITSLLAGLPMNVLHAVSTVVFLAATLIPWGRKLARLKTKYGIKAF